MPDNTIFFAYIIFIIIILIAFYQFILLPCRLLRKFLPPKFLSKTNIIFFLFFYGFLIFIALYSLADKGNKAFTAEEIHSRIFCSLFFTVILCNRCYKLLTSNNSILIKKNEENPATNLTPKKQNIICHKCQFEQEANANFCINCGEKL